MCNYRFAGTPYRAGERALEGNEHESRVQPVEKALLRVG